ncbi:multidrug resistance-associated ABC transporter [Panaeolus papilionaceus]|nr:multidrug resistance-associated ABC transporter [Panaeolus papilionaceus]
MFPSCRHKEGWRIVSPSRDFDLTPCFEEGILLSSLLAFLFLSAVFRSWFLLLRHQPLQRSRKSTLLLNSKIAFLALATATSVANVLFIVFSGTTVPLLSYYIFEPIALTLATILTFYNHTRTKRSSTILLVFWPLYVIATLAWSRTMLDIHFHPWIVIYLKWATILLGGVSYTLEIIGPNVGLSPSEKAEKENPVSLASVYSIWTFGWMTPLMRKGASQVITEEDLPPLQKHDEASELGNDLKQALQKQSVLFSTFPVAQLNLLNFHSTLWKALFVAYGGPYATAAFLKIIQDLLAFAQPQLLRILLSYISLYQSTRFQPEDRPSKVEGFAIVLVMFVASTVQTVSLNQYFQRTFETGMRVRAGLVTAIYNKALVLSNDERSRASGDIVNLMSVDATRLQDLCTYGLIAISGPLQITLAFISLYNLLGWAAFVGVAIMIISIPLNTSIARILKRMQEQQMKNRDKRTRLMSEVLANIKSIKFYAWEYTFMRRILEVRNHQEMTMLRKIGVVTACNMALWSGIPLIVAFSSFTVAAVTSSTPLTSDIIFPAISLFMLLQFPLAMFSQVTSNIIEAWVSVQRLTDFLTADELQSDARTVTEKPSLQRGDIVLSIKDGDFSWSKTAIEPTLEGMDFTVRKGELVGVLGRVGAGKTSLLSAIIGDMTRKEGEVQLFGSVAYAPQNPWIMSATVRENILFFHEYDETFYNLVIEGCALGQDLALLPNGDMTEVGEKGLTLSGGQRARIALARAVYARADLFLLDDCLAAVDSHVARHVFDKVIGPNGLLSTKARILVTNSIAFIKHFDSLLFIRRGIILERGSFQHLSSNPNSEISKLIAGHGTGSDSGASTPYTSGTLTPNDDVIDSEMVDHASNLSEKLRHRQSFQRARIAPPPVGQPISTGLTKEHKEQGKVKVEVYRQYIQAASKIGFTLFLIATVAQQGASVLATITLKYWGEHNREVGSNDGMFKYLLVYGAFSLSATLLGAMSAIIMWVFCALRSSKRLHDGMLEALLAAPLSFFELTPTGRILNLFSRDTYVVDQILGRVIQGLCRTVAVCLSILVVIGASFPPFLLAVIPLGWFYMRVMKYYLATSRELKRLDAVTRSPIFAWFSESLAGLSTIRAFSQQTIFTRANERRIDHNQVCYLPSISVNRWLSVRLEFVGAMIILIVASLAMWALITTGVDAGSVGLVLSYALNTTSSLNWVVRSASEVEQNIVSVERILHQTQVTPEAPKEIPETKPEGEWPSHGKIVFSHYSTRYRPELDLVLRDISLSINAREKVGICGRTGAGKSSLLLALFRIIEPASGTILIDGVDITKIGLQDLRSGLSIVPQSPDLFEGTLRENIDPVGEYSDNDIWVALDQVHLKSYVEELEGKLDTPVREGGSSLSSGQRQLLCFARALLKKSKVLVLDEATSAVDLDTDKAIQEITKGPAFADVTILTIAHRLNTIVNSDRVLVMDAGKVAEWDSPTALLQNPQSLFYSLAKEAGLTGS